MKLLTFAEFFTLPPGVLFSQLPAPDDNTKLWQKGESFPEDEHVRAAIKIVDPTYVDDDGNYILCHEFIFYSKSLEDDCRFAVYGAAELGFLAGVVEAARLAMEGQTDA
jgi:hypothetical protein